MTLEPPPRTRASIWLRIPGAILMPLGCLFLAMVVLENRGFWRSDPEFYPTLLVVVVLSLVTALKIHPVASLSIGIVCLASAPGFVRVGRADNHGAAIGNLRAINSAQQAYASYCGGGGYVSRLEDLQRPPGEGGPAFIAPGLAHGGVVKSGYVITLRPGPGAQIVTPAAKTCNDAAGDTVSTYFAEAHPETYGTSGVRSFATDERGVIYQMREDIVMQPQDLARARPIQ